MSAHNGPNGAWSRAQMPSRRAMARQLAPLADVTRQRVDHFEQWAKAMSGTVERHGRHLDHLLEVQRSLEALLSRGLWGRLRWLVTGR